MLNAIGAGVTNAITYIGNVVSAIFSENGTLAAIATNSFPSTGIIRTSLNQLYIFHNTPNDSNNSKQTETRPKKSRKKPSIKDSTKNNLKRHKIINQL